MNKSTAQTGPRGRLSRPRSEILSEIVKLPNAALLSSGEAAVLLNTGPAVLAKWRSERRGPSYVGNGDFIRYQKGAVLQWLSARAGEVRPAQLEGAWNDTEV